MALKSTLSPLRTSRFSSRRTSLIRYLNHRTHKPTSLCTRTKLNSVRNVPQIHTPASNDTEHPHGKFSKFAEWLETTWYLEIFFLLCSAVCATLIVIFLAIHNNTPIDSWTIYFSINTVVSTLGTVFKSTLFIAVSAALAQGKWTWFRKRNSPLSTFEAIDAASRDTLESFKLLWRMRAQ